MTRDDDGVDRAIDGRSVLVTGAVGGLGRHVVRRFLREGAVVHAPLRRGEEAAELEGFLGGDAGAGRMHLHPECDLARPDAVDRLLPAIRSVSGEGPSILLNLAGGFAAAPVEDTDPALWDRMLAANATTAFLCSRAVLPEMKRVGWGRIVTVSAVAALEGGRAGLAAYAASKSAVLSLTRTLAREGAPHGVTANALLPTVIDTPANREAMPEADPDVWVRPDDIAAVCAFLCSPAAAIVNGAALPLRRD